MRVLLPGLDRRFAGLYLQVLGLSICVRTEAAPPFEEMWRAGRVFVVDAPASGVSVVFDLPRVNL